MDTKPIWFEPLLKLDDIKNFGDDNLGAHLGMAFSVLGADYIEATMPVDHRTRQPYGLLHGGASVALAETLGSVGSALVVDHSKWMCVGLEINANHLRSVQKGFVTGRATPLHIGRSTHVWDIRITDDRGKLVCISRLTVAIIRRPVAEATS